CPPRAARRRRPPGDPGGVHRRARARPADVPGRGSRRRARRGGLRAWSGAAAGPAGMPVSGQDLTAFLRDWLSGTTTPAMPGHPDWTVIPAPLPMSGQPVTAAAAILALPPELD